MPSFATIGFLISTLAVAASAIGTPLPAAGFEQGHFYINHSGTEGCLNDDGKWTLKDCGLFTVEGKGQAAGNWNSVGVRNSRGEKCSIGDNFIFHCSHSTPAAWNHWVYRLIPDPEGTRPQPDMHSHLLINNLSSGYKLSV